MKDNEQNLNLSDLSKRLHLCKQTISKYKNLGIIPAPARISPRKIYPIFPSDKIGKEFTDFNDLFREYFRVYGAEITKKQLASNIQSFSNRKKVVARNSIKTITDNATLRFLERFNKTINQPHNEVTL